MPDALLFTESDLGDDKTTTVKKISVPSRAKICATYPPLTYNLEAKNSNIRRWHDLDRMPIHSPSTPKIKWRIKLKGKERVLESFERWKDVRDFFFVWMDKKPEKGGPIYKLKTPNKFQIAPN